MATTIDQEVILSPEAKRWGMFCHLSALLMISFIPFINIIAPLVVWLLKKDVSPFVETQGVNALNFQITMTVVSFIAIPFMLILIGYFFLAVIFLFNFIQIIIASIKSSRGESYKYPCTINFIV